MSDAKLSSLLRISCALLVVCSCTNSILVKASVQSSGVRPNPQILILLVEGSKLLVSIFLFRREHHEAGKLRRADIFDEGSYSPHENYLRTTFSTFMLFSVPGVCYTICNTLPYLILDKLSVGTYVMVTLLKVPCTALLMKLVLHKGLSYGQWVALAMLCAGSLVSVVDFREGVHLAGPIPAFFLTFLGITLSAFAAVWSEFMLKNTTQSINLQNMQLYFHGIAANLVALVALESQHYRLGRPPKFADIAALLSVVTMAGMGLLTSIVMKHADNILRLFLSGASLSLSRVLASIFFREQFNVQHACGLVFTLFSFFLYDRVSPRHR